MHAQIRFPNSSTSNEIRRALQRVFHQIRTASLATNTALLFANTLIGSILGVTFWVVATRFYTLSAVGLVSAIVAGSTLIATLSNLGFSAVIIRYLPVAGKHELHLCAVSSLVPGLLALVAAPVLSLFPVAQVVRDLNGPPVVAALIPMVLVVGMAVMFVQDAIFIARHQARLVLLRGIGSALARFVLLVPCASLDALGLLTVFTGGVVVSLVLGVSAWRTPRPADTIAPVAIKDMVAYAGTNYASGLLSQAPQMLYPILIAARVSHAAAGAFNFAWMASALLTALAPAAANALLAQLVRTPTESSHRIRNMIRAIVAVIAVLACLIFIALYPVAGLLLREGAGDMRAFLPLLLVSAVLFTVVRLKSMVLGLRSHLRMLLVFNGVVAFSAVVLPLLLLPHFGVLGLELGWFLSQLIGALLALFVKD